MTSDVRGGLMSFVHAAMEPALGERDDMPGQRDLYPQFPASPDCSLLLVRGMPCGCGADYDAHVGPQWSPLLVSGMTQAGTPDVMRLPSPQWSPLLVSGMTRRLAPRVGSRTGPQWSPLLVSGMT